MMSNSLNSLVSLGNKVAVYVPSTVDVDAVADTSEYVSECLHVLADMFGGSTAQPARGAWVSDVAGLIVEDVTIVYAYAAELTDATIDRIVDYCGSLKARLSQEAIALDVNGRMYFV